MSFLALALKDYVRESEQKMLSDFVRPFLSDAIFCASLTSSALALFGSYG